MTMSYKKRGPELSLDELELDALSPDCDAAAELTGLGTKGAGGARGMLSAQAAAGGGNEMAAMLMEQSAANQSIPCSDFSDGLVDILTGKRRMSGGGRQRSAPRERRKDEASSGKDRGSQRLASRGKSKDGKSSEPGLLDQLKSEFWSFVEGFLPSLAPKGAPVKQFQRMLQMSEQLSDLNTSAMEDVGEAIRTGKNVERPKTQREYTDVMKKAGQGLLEDSLNAPINGAVDKVVGDPLKGAAKGMLPEKLIDKGLDGLKNPLSTTPKKPTKAKKPAKAESQGGGGRDQKGAEDKVRVEP